MATIDDMRVVANQILNATTEGENTASRVGGLFSDIIDHLGNSGGSGGGGTVNGIMLGSSSYLPDLEGMVLLPAYPNSVTLDDRRLYVGDAYIDIPTSSGGGTADLSGYTWWGRPLNGNAVKGNLVGDIDFIQFSNGIKLGVDTLNNALKVYKDGDTDAEKSASFYATGGVSGLGYSVGQAGGGGTANLGDLLDSLNDWDSLPDSADTEKILVWKGGTDKWGWEDKPSGNGSAGISLSVTGDGNAVTDGTLNPETGALTLSKDVSFVSTEALNGLKWWGRQIDTLTGEVTGTLDSVENINMTGYLNIGGFVIYKDASGNLVFDGNVYATGGVSGLGYSAGTGGGGGTDFTPGTGLELTSNDVLNVKIDGSTIRTNALGQLYAVSSGGEGTGSTNWNDLTRKPTGIDSFDFTQSYLTSHQDISGKADKSEVTGTFWGQSYSLDSTNVSGSMENVGHIHASGELRTTYADALRMAYGDYGAILRNDGVRTYLLLTDRGQALEGEFNSLRPFAVDDATGLVSMNNGVWIEGTVSDSSNGSFNSLRIGNAVIAWDSINNALKIVGLNDTPGNLYATGGMSALGFQSGDGRTDSATIDNLTSTTGNITTVNAETVNSKGEVVQGDISLKASEDSAAVTLAHAASDGVEVTAKRFYFDSTHWLYVDASGNLKYHKGSEGDKTVTLT